MSHEKNVYGTLHASWLKRLKGSMRTLHIDVPVPKGETEIVKVQRALNNTGLWLFYAKGRARPQAVPDADLPDHVPAAMGEHTKLFFKGVWDNERGWHISEPTDWQEW